MRPVGSLNCLPVGLFDNCLPSSVPPLGGRHVLEHFVAARPANKVADRLLSVGHTAEPIQAIIGPGIPRNATHELPTAICAQLVGQEFIF